MEQIPEKVDFKQVYSLYEGGRDEVEETTDVEEINISNRKGLQERLNATAQEAVSLYKQIGEDSPNAIVGDRPEVRVTSIPVLAKVVDETIPLTALVMKTFKREKPSGEYSETVKVELVKGRLNGTNPKEIYSAWRERLSSGNAIGGMEFANRGEVFDLKDREVYPKFRNQGFANMLLKASEEFIHGMATDDQSMRISKAGDVGQLDVLCWLWNRGYRPEKKEEMDLVLRIFAGDTSLCLATLETPGGGQTLSLCIIDKDTPQSERTRQNYHNIVKKVDLVKPIEPGDSKKVGGIQAGVTSGVGKVTPSPR